MEPCLFCGHVACSCRYRVETSGEGTGPRVPQVDVRPFLVELPRAVDVEELLENIRRRPMPIYRGDRGTLAITPQRPSLATYKAAVRRKHEQLQAARERIRELERRIEMQGGDWRRRD